jgi:branched-subunit amino acid aminotransferase/4-amino-4-deoxychorismate lyase
MGALYGVGLFETVRVYRGHPFALQRHVRRMAAAAKELNLACRWLEQPQTLDAAVWQVLSANGMGDAVLRLTLVAMGDDWEDPRPILTLTARPFSGYPKAWYDDGISMVVAPWKRCSADLDVRLKSANYLTCAMARRYARQHGAEEALLLNCHGRVAEGSVSNVFMVDGEEEIVTPALSEGLLPGVTRNIVLELARQRGLAVRETTVGLDELVAAQEAFITNSLMEIVPVRCVEGKMIRSCVGEVTMLLQKEYRRLVGKAVSGSGVKSDLQAREDRGLGLAK